MLKTMLSIILMMFSASVCLADQVCETLATKVLKAKENESIAWGEYYSAIGAICKTTPDDPGKSFLVIARRIYQVDASNGQVLSQGELGEVSFFIDTIDTGRYWLVPKVRAFGIRSSEYEQHYPTGFTRNSLNLYVIEGSTIRPILEKLDVGSDYACEEKGVCSYYETHVGIAKTRHNGLADLIVSGRVVSYDGARYIVPDDLLQY